jgi:Coenzyme PQQ synthesis protein D (PqqD)
VAECTAYIRFAKRSEWWGQAMHKVSDAVRSTHGQDGAVVLDVQQGQLFNLNLVGSRILELLERGSTESEIVDLISREFHAARDLVEDDVREFLETLKSHKLVEERRSDCAV